MAVAEYVSRIPKLMTPEVLRMSAVLIQAI